MSAKRHKKYTNLAPDSDLLLHRDSNIISDNKSPRKGLSDNLIEAQIEEIGKTEVKTDPDFPAQYRPWQSPARSVFSGGGSGAARYLQPNQNSSTGQVPSRMQVETTSHPLRLVIKSEPMSPRRPAISTEVVAMPEQVPASNCTEQIMNTDSSRQIPEVIDPGEIDPCTNSTTAHPNAFHVNRSLISAVPASQQADELQDLGLTVFNQEEFEQGVLAQVDHALATEEQERMKKIAEKELEIVKADLRVIQQEMRNIEKIISLLKSQANGKEVNRRLKTVQQQRELKLKQLKKLKAKQKSLLLRLKGSVDELDEDDQLNGDNEAGPSVLEQALAGTAESEYERMIRLGEMTPFGTVMSFQEPAIPRPPPPPPKPRTLKADVSQFDDFLRGQEQKSTQKNKAKPKMKRSATEIGISSAELKAKNRTSSSKTERHNHKHEKRKTLRKSTSEPILIDDGSDTNSSFETIDKSNKHTRGGENLFDAKDKRVYRSKERDFSNLEPRGARMEALQHNFSEDGALEDYEVGDEDRDEDLHPNHDDGDYRPDPDDNDSEQEYMLSPSKKKKSKFSELTKVESDEDLEHIKSELAGTKKKSRKAACRAVSSKDDGNLANFEKRLKMMAKEKLASRQKKLVSGEDETDSDSDMEFDRGFSVPGKIWNKLYRYQKTGVRWLWELHCQQAGGIIGDEMGLGKTIQMIGFLVGLKHSKLQDKGVLSRYRGLGPTIIVTPATVMHQWVREFHAWAPLFRVAILHSTGSYTSSDEALIYSIVNCNGILITSFSSLAIRQDMINKHNWHYVILDEGHKIRNPDAQVTLACKTFRTCHRIILSGSPMQNNLKELWSLFDFVFPGKLGTLPDFMAHFSIPIVQGGYSNATEVQVRTAYKCACVLRDTINPYLLRRMKTDVQSCLNLPDKNEQVLFCCLTQHQREIYQEYLGSRECKQILDGNFMVFPGLITLRKVCNHPDLSTGGPKIFDPDVYNNRDESMNYGYWKRSGKMVVVESLLKLWKKQGHRVLLFSQSKQLLDIMETFIQERGYNYLRMDGMTTIASRQPLIQLYNQDNSIYVFLLTTRVGGLGVNLTGANRVIIYDPDWNPSTDTQARERAWRIGQTRPVTIYRLLTTGTIEEKIYHRQIFKQFLTNRVLKDPKQRRFFKSNNLFDLFTLGNDDAASSTETSAIFAGTGSDVRVKLKSRAKARQRASAGDPRSGRRNRFDALRESEDKAGMTREDWSGDVEDGPTNEADGGAQDSRSDTEAKLAKMREIARKLSLKLSGTEVKETDGSTETRHATADGGQSSISSHKKDKKAKNKKKSKLEKKSRTKRKDAYLDGEKISNLDRLSTYHRDNEQDDDKTNDEYVLAKLFKKKGVHSALQHDKIMMSSNPDYALVEGEAERVARDASRALKRSRAQCYKATTGTPTWTGQSGGPTVSKPRFGQKKNLQLAAKETGKQTHTVTKPPPVRPRPEPVPHFDGSVAGSMKVSGVAGSASSDPNVMSSNELLSRMTIRNQMMNNQTRDHTAGDSDEEGATAAVDTINAPDPDTMEMITDIRNAIAFGCRVDGQASTQELLDQFGPRLDPGDSAKFKAMLCSICDLEKRDNIGTWRLKQAFR